ncbi:MAG: glycosyltransferase family 4 protein [Flavobacteriaceae bacterium]
MMRKKVLFVGSFLKRSDADILGGQMYASELLVKGLDDDIKWIKIDSTAKNNLKNSFAFRLYKAIKRFSLFVFYLLTKKIDAVLIFSGDGASLLEKGQMALFAKHFGKKVVFAPRSGGILDDFSSRLKPLILKVFSKVDVVVCQGGSWKVVFQREFPDVHDQKFKVIPNAIDTSLYHPSNKSQPSSPIPKILFLAWVDRNKGIIELIEACKKLNDEGIVFELNICGNGLAFEEANELVKRLNIGKYTIFHGWVDPIKKHDLLSKSSVFVLPTYFEGMPNALLEAMAYGIPSIATNVGAIPDVILNGHSGVLIEAKSIDAIYSALKTVLLDKKIALNIGREGRMWIEKNHATEVVIQKFRSILLELD